MTKKQIEKKAQEEKLKKAQEEQEAAFKENMRMRNAKYFPETEIVISGAEFQTIFKAVEKTISDYTQTVVNREGNIVGVTMPNDFDQLNHSMGIVMGIHKDNYDKGIAIPHDEYVAQMEERIKVEQAKKEAEEKTNDLADKTVDGSPIDPGDVPKGTGNLDELEEDMTDADPNPPKGKVIQLHPKK